MSVTADEADSLRYEIRELRAKNEREINRLRAEVGRLLALLRPFVDMVAEPEDFAAARRALEGTRHQPGT